MIGASFAGIVSVAYAIDALLDVDGSLLIEPSFSIGIYFIWPVIALAALRPSALSDAARPGAGFMAVLAMIADGLLIPVMIALSLVIHLYAAVILLDGALPRGAIGWIATAYLAAGYGLYLLVDGLPVGFGRPRKAFRLSWVPSTVVPLLLLGLATHARIDQYGVTAERYGLVLVVVAGTILFVAALLRRPFDIRIVPATIALLAGIAAAGPIGATATMVSSQIARAQAVLAAVPPEDWAEKGIRALTGVQEETLLEVTKALDRQGRLALLTEAPSWPAALPKTWAGLATAHRDKSWSEIGPTEPRHVNVSWEVYPLSTTTLIPAFDVSVVANESLRSPSGQWMLAARDNRLIVYEDRRETVFDLSVLLPDQPAGERRDIVAIESKSGRQGTLVLQTYDIHTGESGLALTRIRGSILLRN